MTNKEFLEDFKSKVGTIVFTLDLFINVISPQSEDDIKSIALGKDIFGTLSKELDDPYTTAGDLNATFDIRAIRENWESIKSSFALGDNTNTRLIIDMLNSQIGNCSNDED